MSRLRRFLLSEVTNVALNLRTLLIKLQLAGGVPFLLVRRPESSPEHATRNALVRRTAAAPPPRCRHTAATPPPRCRVQVNVFFFLSFFAARIAPIPFLASVWVKADWSRTTPATLLVTALTTPLPVMLNCYWFYLACIGVMRMLRPAVKTA